MLNMITMGQQSLRMTSTRTAGFPAYEVLSAGSVLHSPDRDSCIEGPRRATLTQPAGEGTYGRTLLAEGERLRKDRGRKLIDMGKTDVGAPAKRPRRSGSAAKEGSWQEARVHELVIPSDVFESAAQRRSANCDMPLIVSEVQVRESRALDLPQSSRVTTLRRSLAEDAPT